MAVHEQKHRDEEDGTAVTGPEVVEGEEDRWEGPGGETTPNGGSERTTSPALSAVKEEPTSPSSKMYAMQSQTPISRVPCTPNQIVRSGQLSPSTGTTGEY